MCDVYAFATALLSVNYGLVSWYLDVDLLQVRGAALFTASNLPLIPSFGIRRLETLDPAITYEGNEVNIHRDGLYAWPSSGLEDHFFKRPPVPIERTPLYGPAKETKPVGQLRCALCNGCRSPAYHSRYYSDPVTYPSVGICSWRRTHCAAAKTTMQTNNRRQLIHELPANKLRWNFTKE